MSMLSGQDSAIIAGAVYGVMPAKTNPEVTQFAARNAALAGQPNAAGAALSEQVTPIGGMVGTSGAFIKETTGFGAVLERGTVGGKELIVVFRGTVSKIDWLSNLNFGFEPGPSGSIVHAGFNRVYQSVEDELSRVISAANPSRIHFIGHSLGGAIASIACADFAGERRIPSTLATFGAPRVGSVGLTQDLRQCLPPGSVKRVYSLSDPVPMIPLLPFCHYGTGSSGINAGYSSITKAAHLMDATYIPQMPSEGWPAEAALAGRSDPDYWIAQANSAPSWSQAFGYWALGKALEAIMAAANLVGFGLSAGITVLDRLVQAASSAATLGARIGETLLSWVKAAMRIVGRAADAALSVADLTRSFLESVLNMFLAPVRIAAQMALNNLS